MQIKKENTEDNTPIFNAGLGGVMRLHDVLMNINQLYNDTSNGLRSIDDIQTLNRYFAAVESLFSEGINDLTKVQQKNINNALENIHKINSLSDTQITKKGNVLRFNHKAFWEKRTKCRKVENYIRTSLKDILNPTRNEFEHDQIDATRRVKNRYKPRF